MAAHSFSKLALFDASSAAYALKLNSNDEIKINTILIGASSFEIVLRAELSPRQLSIILYIMIKIISTKISTIRRKDGRIYF